MRSIPFIDIYSIADFVLQYRTSWKVAWRYGGISSAIPLTLDWAEEMWTELIPERLGTGNPGQKAKASPQMSIFDTISSTILVHQKVGSCRIPKNRKGLLLSWEKEPAGGFQWAKKQEGGQNLGSVSSRKTGWAKGAWPYGLSQQALGDPLWREEVGVREGQWKVSCPLSSHALPLTPALCWHSPHFISVHCGFLQTHPELGIHEGEGLCVPQLSSPPGT